MIVSIPMRRRLGVLFAGCAAALICTPAHASATFATFSIQPVTQNAAQGGTGAFDVVVTDNGPGSLSIAGFAFEISAGAGVTFTSADFNTGVTYPYIFLGDSFDQNDTPPDPLFSQLAPLKAGDGTFDGAGITLISGQSFGLGDVLFSVSPTAALGPVTISFIGTPAVADGNNLSDAGGNSIPVSTFSSGTINITAASVPEPSSILLTLAGAGALAGWARRKRRVA